MFKIENLNLIKILKKTKIKLCKIVKKQNKKHDKLIRL